MGNVYANIVHPEITPQIHSPPSFDPLYGFPNGRKEKVMIAKEEEMISAKIPLDRRDYCAHKLLDFYKCRSETWPWVFRCHHEKHAYLNCQADEFITRMKEFEREKRLLERKKRIEQKAKRAEAA